MKKLRNSVIDAVDEFMLHDAKLLSLDAHEQAISHRIAVYLEEPFKACAGVTVDCEYNKHGLSPKKTILIKREFETFRRKFPDCVCRACRLMSEGKKIENKLFRPDIAVHSRGNDYANLIIVEVKHRVVCPFDLTKLKALTRLKIYDGKYCYRLGVFIHFPKSRPHYLWFD